MGKYEKIVFARALRKQMTPPEVYLWLRLRKRIIGQPAWRRQHPFENYVFDYYCPDVKLVVEIDGEYHSMGDNPEKDKIRDKNIKSYGFEIIRLTAKDVLKNPDEIAIWLRQYVNIQK